MKACPAFCARYLSSLMKKGDGEAPIIALKILANIAQPLEFVIRTTKALITLVSKDKMALLLKEDGFLEGGQFLQIYVVMKMAEKAGIAIDISSFEEEKQAILREENIPSALSMIYNKYC